MGLVLQASADLAPAPQDPFMVIDRSLSICALSREGERLLGVSETQAINRHVAEFLVPADAEARGQEDLVTVILTATGGDDGPRHVVVRPTGEFGVRLWVRVGHCGPPSAALLVMADGRV
jgi:PAS domain-containing protein